MWQVREVYGFKPKPPAHDFRLQYFTQLRGQGKRDLEIVAAWERYEATQAKAKDRTQ